MKIHILSDLHIEFEDYTYPACDADVVVLAGDIHAKDKGVIWAAENIPNIPVIYVLGNHEYYGKAHPKFIGEIKSRAQGSNVHVLENDHAKIDGVNFIGCTLWTNFELFGDPRIAGYQCQQVMNDYKKIRKSPRYSKLRSLDVAIIHANSLRWLDKTLEALSGDTNVVVSHHAPSIYSAPVNKRTDITTSAYVSDLAELVSMREPNYWIHGHLHNSSEYDMGNCKVYCNPKGYPGEENPYYDPYKCIEINGRKERDSNSHVIL
ncbi:phosphoesterase [Gammaproteobacteria bacterium 45_16_T64]|nr:phosphoesterase [Gammaproteobacteria bacterium 45_16_T64]